MGTPHIKTYSNVLTGVGTPHMKIYSNVLTGVGTPHNFSRKKLMWSGGWGVAGGWWLD